MSRSPCATSLKTILDIASDFKSPRLKLSPSVLHVNTTRTSLNRLSPYNNTRKCKSPQQLSPGPPHFITATALHSPSGNLNPFSREKTDILLSADSPHRLLFVSKIKTTISTSNLLGRGRFGQVVLAKYKDDYAAVKIVQKPSKQQFINEMNAQHLSHPNIVKVLKIEQIDDDIMIVMEPWGSLNLQQLLSLSVSIPFEDILSYSRQLASALNYCHSKGVLHLDVKPANIMVDGKRWIKLGDFGNSITTEQLKKGCAQQRVGTVSYCAPEILRGEDPSWQSDVYSFGITLWQLEHNQIPFSDLSWPTVVYLVVAKDERPEIRDNLSGKERFLANLYLKCWSPKLEERPSFTEIIASLNNL